MLPYPPSFNRIPANKILPNVGASTWALGNHKCKKYKGSFTKNGIIKVKETIILLLFIINNISKDVKLFLIINTTNSIGVLHKKV